MSYEANRESQNAYRISHYTGDHYFAVETILMKDNFVGHGIVHRHLSNPETKTLLTRAPVFTLQQLLPYVARYAARELHRKSTKEEMMDPVTKALMDHINGVGTDTLANLTL